MPKNYYLPKDISKNYKAIFNGKNIYDEPINSNVKRYEEIRRKLTTGQGKEFTTRYLLDYESVINYIS